MHRADKGPKRCACRPRPARGCEALFLHLERKERGEREKERERGERERGGRERESRERRERERIRDSDLGFGIWDFGFGIWDLGLRI